MLLLSGMGLYWGPIPKWGWVWDESYTHGGYGDGDGDGYGYGYVVLQPSGELSIDISTISVYLPECMMASARW